MEEKKYSQHQMWEFKFIGTADSDKLAYILMDLEVKSGVDHEAKKYLPTELLKLIESKIEGKNNLRVFYSEEFNSFVIEPH